jgi:GT2 family glycosyltransferase
VNFNAGPHLRACLDAIVAAAPAATEVVVVDNNSSDGSAEDLPPIEGLRILRNEQNVGYAVANNRGIRSTSARFVLLLNPDTVPRPGALRSLVAFLDEHPRAGAVGPKIVRPNGQLDLAGRRTFPDPKVAFFRMTGLSRLRPNDPVLARYNLTYRDPDTPGEIDAGTGACLLLRRSALDEVGLLDERFFMYAEDLDLCLRLKQAGWQIWYWPHAIVLHLKGVSSRQQSFRMLIEFHRAMAQFFRKHYEAQTALPLRWAIHAAIWTRCGVLLAVNALRSDRRVSR